MLGRSAAVPTFPAAIKAFRRSQRPSFFGTYRRSNSAARSISSRSSQSWSDTEGRWASSRRAPRRALLDASVPRTDLLADVAPVHHVAQLAAIFLGMGAGACGPVREALRRVERAGLVERAGRAGVDAEPAVPAVEVEGRARLDFGVRHERTEHDPGSVATRDGHRVLAVERDACVHGCRPVDVIVLVDEHAVVAAEQAARARRAARAGRRTRRATCSGATAPRSAPASERRPRSRGLRQRPSWPRRGGAPDGTRRPDAPS